MKEAYKFLPDFIKESIIKGIEHAVKEELEKAKERMDDRKSEIIYHICSCTFWSNGQPDLY